MKLMSYSDLQMIPEVSANEILHWLENPVNEGKVGSILGGLTGLALGKKVGVLLTAALGIPKGSILHDILTSRIVAARIGYAVGKNQNN